MKNLLRESLFVSLVIVIGLTAAIRPLSSNVLIFFLYPGLMLSVLITGGHGGTVFEDRAGLAVGFVANVIVHTLLSALAISNWASLKPA